MRSPTSAGVVLDERTARHFFARLTTGAPVARVRSAVGRDARELFAELAQRRAPLRLGPRRLVRWEEYGCDQDGSEIPAPPLEGLSPAERGARRGELRELDKRQYRKFLIAWIRAWLGDEDPVGARAALFWWGFFPVSFRATLRHYEILEHQLFLHRAALGRFDEILPAMVRSAALLGSLDNDRNRREHPNENFARELLELYSLGEGNYTERDVREAARALTGYQGEQGVFTFDPDMHDPGEKEIFGRRGRFDGDDLARLLLEHPACARYVARRLLAWYEGSEPSPERTRAYASFLLEHDWSIRAFLERLAGDPAFYRPEVLGSRVQGPLEWWLGSLRRLEIESDPLACTHTLVVLGQGVNQPPSVRGWEEGLAWSSPSALVLRSAAIGLALGEPPGAAEEDDALSALSRDMHAGRFPSADPAAALRARLGPEADDEALVREALEAWLAVPPTEEALGIAREALTSLRAERGAEPGPLLAQPAAPAVLRALAHVVLSLPEAHLS